jgi:hypothetical protein
VQFALTDDPTSESSETAVFSISNFAGALVPYSASSTVTITISDNDAATQQQSTPVYGGSSPALVSSPEPEIVIATSTEPLVATSTLPIVLPEQPVVAVPAPVVAPTTTPTTTPKVLLMFTRSLKRGLRGVDVLALQRALNSLGFTISKIGPGSVGKETDLFGIATEAAVKRFQEKYKKELLIPLGLKRATGIVALRTQKLLLQLMASE